MNLEYLSYVITVFTVIQIWMYGQGKNIKIYKWAGFVGIFCSILWIIHTYSMGENARGLLLTSIICMGIHIYNIYKAFKKPVWYREV